MPVAPRRRLVPRHIKVAPTEEPPPVGDAPEGDVAVLIPVRDREEHLQLLLPRLRASLTRLGMRPTFFVAEQADDGHSFNKGRLLNCGFASAPETFRHWIFTDVDVSEREPGTLRYALAENGVKHVFGVKHTLGGCFCIDADTYRDVNGFSNDFWGWGWEDVDFLERVTRSGRAIDREHMVARGCSRDAVDDLPAKPHEVRRLQHNKGLALRKRREYRRDPQAAQRDGLRQCGAARSETQVDGDVVRTRFWF